jgi:hypothetical protein
MVDLPDGIHHGIPFADYVDIPRVHNTALKQIAESPLQYQHYLRHGQPDKAILRRGHAAHTATLEPKRFLREYLLWEGKVRRGREWDAFKAALNGRVDITPKEYDTATAIGEAVRTHPVAGPYFAKGAPEVTILWTDPTTGTKCKARADWVDAAMVDLKTTGAVDPFRFQRTAYRLDYHVQAALYTDGYAAVTGETLPFVLVVVEAAPPHDVIVYRMPEEILEVGREEYLNRLDRLQHCIAANRWPGRCDVEMTFQLPAYAYDHEDDDADALGLDFGEREAS